MSPAALEPAEERRVVEVDVTESPAQQLERVAGQRIGVVGVYAQLVGNAVVTFA